MQGVLTGLAAALADERPDLVVRAVDLSGAEYDLLLAFLDHPQRVLARDRISELARGRLADAFDRSVDVLVSRLRRKIEGGEGGAAVIKTVRGAGYIFLPAVERVA